MATNVDFCDFVRRKNTMNKFCNKELMVIFVFKCSYDESGFA